MEKYTIPILARLCASMLSQSLVALMLLLGVQNVYALTPQEVAKLSAVLVANANAPVNANTLNLFKSKHVVGNMLNTGQILEAPQALVSSNGAFYAGTNSDGQFTIINSNGQQVWLAASSAAPNGKVAMQGDGNLCLYPSGNGGQVWCSRSNGATGSYVAILRDTGVLEIYKGDQKNINPDNLIWTSLLDPVYYNNRYTDLNNAYHGDWIQLMYHWITYGRYEARSPRAGISDDLYQQIRDVHLDPIYYVNKYPDVYRALGRDPAKLFGHWITYGIKEGRIPNSGVDNFLKASPHSANGLSYMRVGDWLGNDNYLESKNKKYVALLMNDGPIEVFGPVTPGSGKSGINNGNRVFSMLTRMGRNIDQRLDVKARTMFIQPDGHFCTYEGTHDRVGAFVGCVPQGADEQGLRKGSYFITLEDDGNLVIHRGPGPDDDRGYVWQSNSERMQKSMNWWEKAQADIGDVAVTMANGVTNSAFQVSTWATNTANSVANETVNAANTVAGVSVNALNDLKDELNSLVNSLLDELRKVCSQVGKFLPGPATTLKGTYGLGVALTGSAGNSGMTDATNCAEKFQQGYYCQIPEEIADMVGGILSITEQNQTLELAKKIIAAANEEPCKDVKYMQPNLAAINGLYSVYTKLGGPKPEWIDTLQRGNLQINCAILKVVGEDAIKAGKCGYQAAMSGNLENYFYLDDKTNDNLTEKRCRLAGKLSLKVTSAYLTSKVPTTRISEFLDLAQIPGNLAELERKLSALPACSDESYPTIIGAWYGEENGVHLDIFNGVKFADIIAKSTLSNGGTVKIPADMNTFFGVDPVPNKAKVVAVQLKQNGTVINIRQKEGKELKYPGNRSEDYFLPEDLVKLDKLAVKSGAQPSTNTISKSGKTVEVGRAWYGIESKPLWDINGKNIADTIRSVNKDGTLFIPANMNNFFGMDPMPGIQKEVAVEIKYDGKVIYLRQSEGKALKFPGVEGVDYRIIR